jgi:hypothetical protein
MSLATLDLLIGVIATLALRGIAFHGLSINNGQGRTGLALGRFAVGQDQKVVDLLPMMAVLRSARPLAVAGKLDFDHISGVYSKSQLWVFQSSPAQIGSPRATGLMPRKIL